MKKLVTYLLCGLSITMLFTSCARYEAASLSAITTDYFPHTEKKNNVSVACKALTKNDCKRYLGRDVIKEGYQPVQITINNGSDRPLLFSPKALSLPCASADAVSSKVHTSTAGRATAYGVGAFFFLPLAIPAIVDGVGSSAANRELDHDYAAKAASEQIIFPHSTLNTLIFVPRESFQERLSMILIDKVSNDTLDFNVLIADA